MGPGVSWDDTKPLYNRLKKLIGMINTLKDIVRIMNIADVDLTELRGANHISDDVLLVICDNIVGKRIN
jgi:hypothetical protein